MKGIEFKQFSLGGREKENYRPLLLGLKLIFTLCLSLYSPFKPL